MAGVAEKRSLFRVFLETLRDPNLASEHKIKCLSLVVIPVLTTTLEDPHTNNSDVVTDSLVSGAIRGGFATERDKREREQEKGGERGGCRGDMCCIYLVHRASLWCFLDV